MNLWLLYWKNRGISFGLESGDRVLCCALVLYCIILTPRSDWLIGAGVLVFHQTCCKSS